MNVTITFRHLDASEAMKQHAHDKVAKLQKFLRRPVRAKVTLSLEKVEHVAEAQIASGGERYEASEATDDMYASIDKVIDKIERQIRGSKGASQSKKRRSGATLRGGSKPEPIEPIEPPAGGRTERSVKKTAKRGVAKTKKKAAKKR